MPYINAFFYMSLPLEYPEFATFFSFLLVANRTPSRSDATVNTPPTIAHVLIRLRTMSSCLSLRRRWRMLTR